MAGAAKGLVAVCSVLAAVSAAVAAPAHADEEPAMHHVKYVLTSTKPTYANIYYLDREPAVFADYSHDPYRYVPNIHADVGPDSPWTYELHLANPYHWAFFTASTGHEPGVPGFRCQLIVDGAIVEAKDGDKGVLCSMRVW